MTDREKIIKGLEVCTSKPCYCTDCPYKANCCLDSQEVMEDALALLKEQEAVKPIAKEDDMFECVCGAIVGWKELDSSGIVTTRLNYCPFCGKAVKWDE